MHRPVIHIQRYGLSGYRLFVFSALMLAPAVIAFLLLSSDAHGQSPHNTQQSLLTQPQKITRLVESGKLSVDEIPNPHWRKDACQACHRSQATAKNLHLRNRDINKGCNYCHKAIGTHVNIHPVGMTPSAEIQKNMPKNFRKTLARAKGDNKLTCLSCHDIVLQCKTEHFVDQRINPRFIRGAPYRSRTGLCYQCHERKAYQRLNSHDQISDTGELLKEKCLICHPRVPHELDDETAVDAELHVETNYSSLCLNCHQWVAHPGGDLPFMDKRGPMHLVVPPPGIARHMEKMQRKNQLTLPLEEDSGRIYCATCHNPHERGVIQNPRAAKGADEPKRLRAKYMCENCHDL